MSYSESGENGSGTFGTKQKVVAFGIVIALIAAAFGVAWLMLRGANALTTPQPEPLHRFDGKAVELYLGNRTDRPLRLGGYRFEPGSGLFWHFDPTRGKLRVHGIGKIVDELSGGVYSPPAGGVTMDPATIHRFLEATSMPECSMLRLDPSKAFDTLLSRKEPIKGLTFTIETANPSDQSALYVDIGPEKEGSRRLELLQQSEKYPEISSYNLPRGLYRFECTLPVPSPFTTSLSTLVGETLKSLGHA